MKLNSKLTGGLAWAGLIIVLAVPSADLLTKANGNAAATMTSDMDAVETANVAPAAAPAAAPRVIVARPGEEPVVVQSETQDPVEQYLSSGKKLPSYISDAPAEVASKEPAPVTKLVPPEADAPAQPVEVAAVEPDEPAVNANLAPPLPYPASMRPIAPPAATAPITTASAAPAVAPEEEPVVIVDEDLVARREAAVAAVLGNEPFGPEEPSFLTDEDLEEWDSGSLAEYLERRGLINGDEASTDFDEDGFFIDERPNDTPRRRLRREFIFF